MGIFAQALTGWSILARSDKSREREGSALELNKGFSP